MFDADRIRFPLRLRAAEPGDRIAALGRRGHSRIVDLQRESELPGRRRSSALVVEDAAEIIWAVGLASAERTHPQDTTARLLRLTVRPRGMIAGTNGA